MSLKLNMQITDTMRLTLNHRKDPESRLESTANNYSSRSPLDPPNYRASEAFTESSVYSRPSNDLAYYDNPTSIPSYAYEEISPPSSPEPEQQYSTSNQPRRFRSMRDVSPMDDHRGKPVLPPHGSNIPVLRKAPPVLQTGQTQPAQKFWGGKVAPEGKVKWDEYSGEPTASGAGKTGSVSPNSYAKGVASSGDQLSGMGYHVSVSGPKRKASIKDRMGRFGGRPSPPSVETATHEPWSRATGRSQIAPPLKDQAAKAPLQLPRKTLSPTAERSNTNAPSDNGNRGVRWADTGSVADRPQALESHEDLIKPTPRHRHALLSHFAPHLSLLYPTAPTPPKRCPSPPTSLSAADHIAVLESAMEDLRIRRSNVYRLLNDLNNAAPPNPLITDFKRARLVEQRKRSFEDELCEIKREEYEVGMKLHRAWKKREREDPNVGSAIWVRRVTS
ncbi:hypothetical protein SNOG_07953 [Parastagonospora nodorum SN15]|uniref:Uncharacterized protein n=1 Tax=Phaeosphaeria nodorum (strain SN15 / ATCC MYA-4574 / FGSC 10173) TaxID=321614 RepID=Q0UJW1_PHANO|nr:hypothetical protein SNOG_07953 [Parastagonospora nodorum SN15]EAT84229.2 hypothetical protein SNOG_07953 [Parastagonospora nodorum SN15]